MAFKKTLLFSALVLGFGLTGSAQALTITDSFITPSATTDFSINHSLALFDSSLGTLNSVTFGISAHSDSTTTLNNNSAIAQFFNYNSSLNFVYNTSIAGLTALLLPPPQLITSLATTGGFVSLASGASLALGQTLDQALFTTSIITNEPLLSNFIGGAGSTFSVSCNTLTSSSFTGGGGNIATQQVTTGQCDASVVYNYTATVTPPSNVPEPALLALLGMGLIGFRFGRKFAKHA